MNIGPRYEAREMGGAFVGYQGVWDKALRKWATWSHVHAVPMRFKTSLAANTTAARMSRGEGKV